VKERKEWKKLSLNERTDVVSKGLVRTFPFFYFCPELDTVFSYPLKGIRFSASTLGIDTIFRTPKTFLRIWFQNCYTFELFFELDLEFEFYLYTCNIFRSFESATIQIQALNVCFDSTQNLNTKPKLEYKTYKRYKTRRFRMRTIANRFCFAFKYTWFFAHLQSYDLVSNVKTVSFEKNLNS